MPNPRGSPSDQPSGDPDANSSTSTATLWLQMLRSLRAANVLLPDHRLETSGQQRFVIHLQLGMVFQRQRTSVPHLTALERKLRTRTTNAPVTSRHIDGQKEARRLMFRSCTERVGIKASRHCSGTAQPASSAHSPDASPHALQAPSETNKGHTSANRIRMSGLVGEIAQHRRLAKA